MIKETLATGFVVGMTLLGGYAGAKVHEASNRAEYAVSQERYEQLSCEDWFQRAREDSYIGRRNAESAIYMASHNNVFYPRKFCRNVGGAAGLLFSLLLASALCGKREEGSGNSSGSSRGSCNQGSDPDTWTRTSGEYPFGLR